jgi:tRNA threonylcarbamoyl adenosine modification protein YeaZ
MSGSQLFKGLSIAIESTDPPGSIALGMDGHVVAFRTQDHGQQLSESFLPLLDAMLQETGANMSDIQGVVVCSGPGSFTGIRVGFSFAYGIAQARGIMIYPVPTLDVMAYSSPDGYDLVFPYISIRPENLIYKIVSHESFVFGPGYIRYRGVFNRSGVGPYPGEEDFTGVLNARALLEYFYSGNNVTGVNPEDAQPIYVRPSEAELKFSRRRK